MHRPGNYTGGILYRLGLIQNDIIEIETVITSYSIHYTKLYDAGNLPDDERILTPGADYAFTGGDKVLPRVFGITTVVAVLLVALAPGFEEIETVITSYSIHYTKLYDARRCRDR